MDLIITILPVVTKDLPISPRFTPYNFLSRCKFSTLTTRQPMVEFYLLTFPRFPLRKKEHKSQGKRHNRVHPGHFATQQGTPFYPAGMSADDWSTLVFTLPRRKIAWVHPTKATFFQNCTLILDKYPVVSENETVPPAISPAEILSAPARGHQNTHLPALNIQCGTGIKDLYPALPHILFLLYTYNGKTLGTRRKRPSFDMKYGKKCTEVRPLEVTLFSERSRCSAVSAEMHRQWFHDYGKQNTTKIPAACFRQAYF